MSAYTDSMRNEYGTDFDSLPEHHSSALDPNNPAEAEGYQAQRSGRTYEDNPYQYDAPEWDVWYYGFSLAESESEQD